MIPRTVQMAKEVATQFSPSQEVSYGNIILNGYATTGPNTTGKMSWAWADSPLLPAVPLPAVTSVQPVLKGWTTNYAEYYTRIPPNSYNVNPGDPTMFEYTVHSFDPAFGIPTAIGGLQGGQNYPVGNHPGLPTSGGSGTGATLNLVVGVNQTVTSATLATPGSGYAVGDGLTVSLGSGTLFCVFITAITEVVPPNIPKWSQPPHRLINSQVAPFVPPNANQQAIQYSAILYPVADTTDQPPIDFL